MYRYHKKNISKNSNFLGLTIANNIFSTFSSHLATRSCPKEKEINQGPEIFIQEPQKPKKMYSTYSKKENAHDEAGWCCAWKRFEPSEEAMDTSENPENGGENKENEEDQSKKSPPEPREAVITGG